MILIVELDITRNGFIVVKVYYALVYLKYIMHWYTLMFLFSLLRR